MKLSRSLLCVECDEVFEVAVGQDRLADSLAAAADWTRGGCPSCGCSQSILLGRALQRRDIPPAPASSAHQVPQ